MNKSSSISKIKFFLSKYQNNGVNKYENWVSILLAMILRVNYNTFRSLSKCFMIITNW